MSAKNASDMAALKANENSAVAAARIVTSPQVEGTKGVIPTGGIEKVTVAGITKKRRRAFGVGKGRLLRKG